MSTIIDIAEAVAAELNAAEASTFSQDFTAQRKVIPAYKLEELDGLKVSVVPKAVEITAATRIGGQHDFAVDIGIQNAQVPGGWHCRRPPRIFLPPANVLYSNPCTTLSDFTFSGCEGSLTSNWSQANNDGITNAGILLTPDGASSLSTATLELPSEIDGTNAILFVRYYLPSAEEGNADIGEHVNFNLRVYDNPYNSGRYLSAQTSKTYYTGNGDDFSGWYTVEIPLRCMVNTGSCDITKLKRLLIRHQYTATKVCKAVIAQAMFYLSPWSQGYYLIRTDCSAMFYDYHAPILNYATHRNVPLCVSCIPRQLGESFCMTVDQYKAITRNHDVSSYTGEQALGGLTWRPWGGTSGSAYTFAQKLDYLKACRNGAYNKGIIQAAKRLHLSSGAGWTSKEKDRFVGKWIEWASGSPYFSSSTYRPPATPFYIADGYLPWTGFIDSMPNGDAPDWLATAIAHTESAKGVLVLGAHLNDSNDRLSLKNSIDALLASNLKPITWDDLYHLT